VAEVETSLDETWSQLEGAADLAAGTHLVSTPVERVSERRYGLRIVRPSGHCPGESVTGMGVEALPIEGPANREQKVDVSGMSELLGRPKQRDSLPRLSEPQENLSESDKGIFVSRIENPSLLERHSSPGELLASQAGISQTHIELHGTGIKSETLLQHREGPLIVTLVVESMRALVVFL
jgi:hypothetical protein